ncbi:hypothetical protein DITRI_Ditri20bG0002000 [Diplodiscus trichospermus]
MPVWGFWVSPVTYGEIGLSVNEFLAPRWQRISSNTTIGQQLLESCGLNFEGYLFWISVAALFGFTVVFNTGFTMALSFLKSPGSSRALISHEKLSQIQAREDSYSGALEEEKSRSSAANMKESSKGNMILPFEPLTVAFQDLQYYVDTPLEMRERGFAQKELQLLSDITSVFRLGVLTALMGVSGAGKTTLLDVLAGRKTTGYVEGEIRIGGYLKVQETFARISGYCEQSDIHSPRITVEESVVFSAWLRLAPQIDSKTKAEFVNQVLETIELDGIKDALVGIPGVSGLSTEQCKRLTIAVELVANPSVISMDEPTTGLDARAAAIVMRAVKNVADTGRTIVCTIHQPSIDIFEALDELILLKNGGRIIYAGPLGEHSSKVIDYFEGISGVPKIRNNYNPATWMLDGTSTSSEDDKGIDFAQIYKDSALYESNREIVEQLSTPPPGSRDLHFHNPLLEKCMGAVQILPMETTFVLLEKSFIQLNPYSSNFSCILSFRDNQQNLFNILGSMFTAATFLGINNCSAVLPYVETERSVMYRERFAGMYSAWAYALAQVTVEIPYLFIQSVMFVTITYPMIGYYGSAYKIFWYFYAIFCTLLYYNCLGMSLVSLTPNFILASILSSVAYKLLNLFAGFLIPQPQIPGWWIWLYYLTPTSWTMRATLTSQYGDIDKEIMVFGETKRLMNSRLRNFLVTYDYGDPVYCYYGLKAPLVTSTSDENPRRFFGCSNYQVNRCRFFLWYDGPIQEERAKEVIIQLRNANKDLTKENMKLKDENSNLRKMVPEHKNEKNMLISCDDLIDEVATLRVEIEAMERKLHNAMEEFETAVATKKIYKNLCIVFGFYVLMVILWNDNVKMNRATYMALP